MTDTAADDRSMDSLRSASHSRLASLRKHHCRLLLGGGLLLSVLIIATAAGSIYLQLQDYLAQQQKTFSDGKIAVDTYLAQRDRGLSRSLNVLNMLWRERHKYLTDLGRPIKPVFEAAREEVLIKANASSIPILALGHSTMDLPRSDLSAYLGLIYEASSHGGATVTETESPGSTTTYGYEPSGSLFTFTRIKNEQQLLSTLGTSSREEAFSRLMLSPQRLHPNATGPNSFESARTGRIVSFYGENPLTREPSIVGVMNLMDQEETYYRLVTFEPLWRIGQALKEFQGGSFMIVSQDGELVLRHMIDDATLHDALGLLKADRPEPSWSDTPVVKRSGGTFLMAMPLRGVDWTIVHTFDVHDIVAATGAKLGFIALSALLCLYVLWILLRRIERRAFRPALHDAMRVYESEALSRTIVEMSPIGLCLIDRQSAQPILHNDVVKEFAAEAKKDGKHFYARLLAQYLRAEYNDCYSTRVFCEFRTELDINGDTSRTLLIAARPTIFRGKHALLCAVRDVTATAELEASLREAKQAAEQAKYHAESANKAKSTFVATISHEIRTPLSGILGHLELLAGTSLDTAQHEQISRIRASADILLKIIGDVLDFSKIEADQLDLLPSHFSLRALIEECALLYAPMAKQKDIKLFYRIDRTIDSHYVGDAVRIGQVLNNLLSNALKFTEHGEVMLRVTSQAIVSDVTEAPTRVVFEVIDSGIGIAMNQINSLFEPFHQANASISGRFGGTGLGLALCKRLTILMGGHLTVKSTLGEGATFTFTIPLVEAGESHPCGKSRLAGKRIALSVSEPRWSDEFSSLLSAQGAEVIYFSAQDRSPWCGDSPQALIFFEEPHATDHASARLWIAEGAQVISVSREGPLLPRQEHGAWCVSYYASEALMEVLEGKHQQGMLSSAMHTADAPYAPLSNRRILVVDDNAYGRELLRQQLEVLGCMADTANGGAEAIVMWKQHAYAALLTDIHMPGMDGYELAEKVRKEGAEIPIIALTAGAQAKDWKRSVDVGITELILKPITLEQLDRLLRSHLEPEPRLLDFKHENAASTKLMELFVSSIDEDFAQLLQAAASSQQSVALQRLHTLKGVFAMANEPTFAATCQRLEESIGSRGLDGLDQDWQDLQLGIDELLRTYRERFTPSA
ncbi:two-component system, NarL family, capsular synthesis sensor histidine kinase RcsC [Dyella sp. OK004]|uniref:hybrid sensor histidine kinase/response regulator n=1 Tax=Dyella sp. OK004 TaxID=1855292 RepID=UPI0008EE6539|nr:hybrid sensor histidine kinase/response regulator [Dyella sp. OK004]SFS06343.1 two-component system, NarL family, capsular synthesis sensor histidine kinase RcsC [Dyella sp. OK004]